MSIRLSLFVVALLVVMTVPVSAAAQESQSTLTGEDLGFPELSVTATDDGWDAPESVEAGRYLLTVDYRGDQEFGTAAFVRLPDGWSYEDLQTAIEAEQELEETGIQATPSASDGTTVAPSSNGADAIALLDSLTYAGGLSVIAGETSQGIIDLQPGNWALWADNFDIQPRPLEVTGLMQTDLAAPPANVTITQINVGDHFGWRIDGDFKAGQNIIKISNASDQPHLVELIGISQAMTPLEFFSLVQQTETGEPIADVPVPAGASLTFTSNYAATLSSGMTQWLIADIAPGDYYMACWVRDRNQPDLPHAALGELELITVA